MPDISFFAILAALSAGVAATCLFLLVIELFMMLQMEEVETVEDTKRLPFIIRLFLPFVPNAVGIAKADLFVGLRKQSQDQILMAGLDQAMTPEQFVAVRILIATAAALFAILMAFCSQPLLGIMIIALAVLYPAAWMRRTVKLRHLLILKALPNVLDLLTLSVEAGKDFLTALRDILSRRKIDPLGEELSRALHEIQLGKQRQQALKEMAARVQHPELSSIVNAIVQADELGVGIGQLLRIQGDQLRAKRFARAEKLANEAPVKILFPVIVFIFPVVIVLLMAPIILQAMKTFAR